MCGVLTVGNGDTMLKGGPVPFVLLKTNWLGTGVHL